MIVVSDTTPLNYLILIQEEEILPKIFGEVYVPVAVLEELLHPKAPERVREWASRTPDWVAVREPTRLDPTLPVKLHRGEVQAISLAQELGATQTRIDDWAAFEAARDRGLHPIGTLTVLGESALLGDIDIEEAIEKLRNTSFWASELQYLATIDWVRKRKLVE